VRAKNTEMTYWFCGRQSSVTFGLGLMRRLGLTEAVWMASSNDLPCSKGRRGWMNSFWNDAF
jgi:hypothetical protein